MKEDINKHLRYSNTALNSMMADDLPSVKQSMAKLALYHLKIVRSMLDRLLTDHPGLTAGCLEIKLLAERHNSYYREAEHIFNANKAHNPLDDYIELYTALDRAELPGYTAIEAVNGLNKVQYIRESLTRRGETLPSTILDRIGALQARDSLL